MKSLKIAIDASHYNENAVDGLNRYTRAILREIPNNPKDWIVYTSAQEIDQQHSHQVRSIQIDGIERNNFYGNFSRLLWHQTVLPRSLKQEKVAIAYSPVPEGMLFPVCPQIITIHDLLPIFYPETYPRLKYYFQYILPRLIQASSAMVAVSENTKRDLEKRLSCQNKPIHVIYQSYRSDIFKPVSGESLEQIKQQYQLSEFILCVGETRPYKNIRRLIQAFEQLMPVEFELAIVGKLNKMDLDLLQLPKQLGISTQVKFLGCVTDDELAALYSAAKAFVFPSLYEGFGIPPLEAMACGCPVVVSRVASLPELCADAAYYVDPCDSQSIAEGIYRVAKDDRLRNILRLKGLERAKFFQNREMLPKIVKIIDKYLSL